MSIINFPPIFLNQINSARLSNNTEKTLALPLNIENISIVLFNFPEKTELIKKYQNGKLTAEQVNSKLEEVIYNRREKVAEFIKYSVDSGAKAIVLDMWIGSDGYADKDAAFLNAINYANKKGVPVFFGAGLTKKTAGGTYILDEDNSSLPKFKDIITSGHNCALADTLPATDEVEDYNRVPVRVDKAKPLSLVVLEKLYPDMEMTKKPQPDREGTVCFYYPDLNKDVLDKRSVCWDPFNDENYKSVNLKDQIVFLGGNIETGDAKPNSFGQQIPGVYELISILIHFSKYMKKKGVSSD